MRFFVMLTLTLNVTLLKYYPTVFAGIFPMLGYSL